MIVKRITPENVEPEPFIARCTYCVWAMRSSYLATAEALATKHVRDCRHIVDIEDDTPATTSAGA